MYAHQLQWPIELICNYKNRVNSKPGDEAIAGTLAPSLELFGLSDESLVSSVKIRQRYSQTQE
jgi:hypothetical protein